MIVIKPGHGELSGGPSLSFVEAMATPGYLDRPVTARGDAGAKLDNLFRLVEAQIAEYSRALTASAGETHIAERLGLNVKASIRRNSPSLAAILGLA